GVDGSGSTTYSYALVAPAASSGLVDTATGQAVTLSLTAGGVVEGRTAASNELVFTVSVDSSGKVTLDQKRSIVHPDTTSNNESKTLSLPGLLKLTGTTTDKDGDSTSKNVSEDIVLVFKDDGPSITGTATGAPTLTVDES